MPKVSVIMGVYNGSKGIEKSIQSILMQTFDDFELIVCDDGSTDNSVEIIKRLSENDHRIKLIFNAKNLGLAPTLNNCLRVANGEFIARMDDDDVSHPERFEKQVSFLNSHLEYAIVGTSRNMVDSEGIWGKHILDGRRSKLDVYLGNTFVHPSVMMRKDAVLKVGGYSVEPEIGRTEDYDLWCKLYENGYEGFNLSDILINYFESPHSYKKRKFKYRVCEYKLRKKWRKKLGIPLKYAPFAYRTLIVGLIPTKLLIRHHERKYKFSQ